MKIQISIIIALIFLVHDDSDAGKIRIFVSNFAKEEGVIRYGVYNDPEFFPNEEGKILGGSANVSKVINNGITINNLEESIYAVAIYHDQNSNKEFDTFLSIPVERYGFSNNAEVFLGPPEFEDAAIFVGADDIVDIMIELR